MNNVKEGESQNNTQSPLGVPVAIVIAGGLIAAAIYFSNAGVFSKVTSVEDQAVGEQVAPEPQGDNNAVAPGVGEIRPVAANDYSRGPENAKVTVIEYSDIECPFCQKFHPTMTKLVAEYPNDVRWVWRHFPLEQLHDNARGAALATECAGEQGKFWELLDHMMLEIGDSSELAEANLPKLAQTVGVKNMSQFNNCLEEKKYNQKVDEDIDDAVSAGGRGTPYSVIVGPDGEKEAISGAQPYEAVKAAVDKYL